MRKTLVFLGIVLLWSALVHAANGSTEMAQASVSPERIRAHVKFLASDLLEGRGTGQRGGDIAAEYIATQFALYGLKPAGEDSSYMQKVPMVGITTQPETKVELVFDGAKPFALRLGEDVVIMDESQNTASDVDAPLVFVGYGIEAPEFQWSDFKDVDVRGKVLLVLVNEPPSDDPKFFTGQALTYYGRWTYKFEEAARRGAAGVLLVHKKEMASYGWDVVKNSWSGERSQLRQQDDPVLRSASWIQLEIADRIAKAAGTSIDKLMEQAQSRNFRPIPLPVRVTAHIVSKVRPFESHNVLGMITGSDSQLSHQAVLYTAHYDHLGIRPEQSGDNIYNGAVDNATGCGILLEMARAFVTSAQKPKRSILFAAVTGEEQGLLGSRYLGEHSPLPVGDITLNLNFDALNPIGIPQDFEVSGAERTTFYPAVEQTAQEFNLTIQPDHNPGAGYYYRSDHFSLARVGIPGFSVDQGSKYKGLPKWAGEKLEQLYSDKSYHQPSDEFHEEWNFSGLAQMARLGIALGWRAADLPQLIQWRPGDEFEAARKSSQSDKAAK